MAHPLVEQLRFTRAEFVRGLQGVSGDDGCRRLEPMNCLSWIVGHLATQEQNYWCTMAQGQTIVPELRELFRHGRPAVTPPLLEMWAAWRAVTAAADRYLDTLTPNILGDHLAWQGRLWPENIGTLLLRNIYHYWFHLGEASAIRQQLGHTGLPDFVGPMPSELYRPE
jgi:hypothetical protein